MSTRSDNVDLSESSENADRLGHILNVLIWLIFRTMLTHFDRFSPRIILQGGQPNLKTKFHDDSRSFWIIFQEFCSYRWQRCILYSTIYSQAKQYVHRTNVVGKVKSSSLGKWHKKKLFWAIFYINNRCVREHSLMQHSLDTIHFFASFTTTQKK